MRSLEELFADLNRSDFRRRFRLNARDAAYLRAKGLAVVLAHGREFLRTRLAPAEPRNDGKQTPMRGHPIFVAQHATATCCRGCLARWHHIPAGRELSAEESEYVLNVLRHWLERHATTSPKADIPRGPAEKRGRKLWADAD